jgi:hypothetical protein
MSWSLNQDREASNGRHFITRFMKIDKLVSLITMTQGARQAQLVNALQKKERISLDYKDISTPVYHHSLFSVFPMESFTTVLFMDFGSRKQRLSVYKVWRFQVGQNTKCGFLSNNTIRFISNVRRNMSSQSSG